jgi:hypothetical protein
MNKHFSKEKSLLFIAFQLIIIGWFLHHFNIETQFNLPFLFPLIVVAFLVHSASPGYYKQWIFISATIIGLVIILSFKETLILLSLILGMIAICNLNISHLLKNILLISVGLVLALTRYGLFPSWITSQTLVILSSMFMFRMILFLYEIRHQKERVSYLTQVSYFLMPPNIIFPLFPVVDYKLFQKNYYDKDEITIYQRGVRLIAKGILHMFLYRIIYSFLLPTIDEVHTLTTLISYIIFSYLLVLRLSGLFHFSVGVLCLFGYNLPDIFKNIFLAESFSDLWRRLNIYWKDYMVKIFFNPLYFKLKKYGTQKAIFWSTLISFVITMLLHSYQTFWLIGTFRISTQDIIFWSFFGFMVAIYTLTNTGETKMRGAFSVSLRKTIRIFSTFIMMALLWSMWSSQSVESFLHMLNISLTSYDMVVVLVSTIVIISIGTSIYYIEKKEKVSFSKSIVSIIAPLTLLTFILLTLTFNSWTLEKYWKERIDGNDIHFLFHFTLKESDSQNEIAGYYDNILSTTDLMSPLVSNSVSKSKAFQVNLYKRNIVFKSNDAFKRKFTPFAKTTIQGVEVSINRWGMYDEDYDLIPTEDTYRIAVLGGSIEMGWAIPSNESLEKIIEKRLNKELINAQYKQYQLLNFSVPSRSILNQNYALRNQVVDFKPNMIIFFDHDETEWINIIKSIQEYDYSKELNGYIDSIYVKERLPDKLTVASALNKFEKHRVPLMRSIYKDIFDVCLANDILPVMVAMPEIRVEVYDRKYKHPEIAKDQGFMMIDLSAIFDPELVASYSMDRVGHPTLEAYQHITNALYLELKKVINIQIDSQ